MSETDKHIEVPFDAGDASADATGAEETGSMENEFIAEEKKTINPSTLVLFAIILAGAVGMYFMYLRSGPSSASAATEDQVKADQTINSFLSGNGANLRQMEMMLRNTEKVVQQFLAYPSVNQVPLTDLQTNPFKLSNDRPRTEDNTDELANKRDREAARQAALRAVGGLRLQSVIHSGTRRACMINNVMYEEGQQVNEFSIERINPNAVIVKTGAYRFELRMQK